MYVFLSWYLLLSHIGRVHGENSGRTVSGGLHPGGAQNNTLISDTEYVFHNIMLILIIIQNFGIVQRTVNQNRLYNSMGYPRERGIISAAKKMSKQYLSLD